MSAVVLFIVLTAALTLVVVAALLRPWARLPARTSERASESVPAGLEIYRSQWQALARDWAAGLLSAEDFDPAREDLRRRVLAEINETDEMDATAATAVGAAPDAASRGLSGRSAWVLAAAMPLAAVLIYVGIGNPQALTPPPAARQDTAALARRVAQLKANPGDAEGWLALARAYEVLGRFPEAAEAFEKGRARVDGDPALLAEYAYALIRAEGGVVGPRAEALIDAALKLDPQQPQALFLAGLAANERGDFAAAIAHWQRLLPLLETGSDKAVMLEKSLQAAQEKMRRAANAKSPATSDKRPHSSGRALP